MLSAYQVLPHSKMSEYCKNNHSFFSHYQGQSSKIVMRWTVWCKTRECGELKSTERTSSQETGEIKTWQKNLTRERLHGLVTDGFQCSCTVLWRLICRGPAYLTLWPSYSVMGVFKRHVIQWYLRAYGVQVCNLAFISRQKDQRGLKRDLQCHVSKARQLKMSLPAPWKGSYFSWRCWFF
jgi:hypothetical protein